MSTLSGTSTLAEVQAAYDDNASYAEDGSTAKASAFLTACRILLRRIPTEAGKGSNRVRTDENLRRIQAELHDAQAWLATHPDATDGVMHPDFSSFRG